MLSKERFISLFIYIWKKKARDFTKIYAFQPFCENSERILAFNSFSQKLLLDVQVGTKYFSE